MVLWARAEAIEITILAHAYACRIEKFGRIECAGVCPALSPRPPGAFQDILGVDPP